MIAPFQCDRCWFINVHKRVPLRSSPGDQRALMLIRRVNLDVFWSREERTVSRVVGELKYIVSRSKETQRLVPLEPFQPWDLNDYQDMGLAMLILEKALQPGRKNRPYQQFATVRQLRAAASNVYSASAQSSKLRYTLKSVAGDTAHMYEGETQTLLMERFMKGMRIRMPQDSDRNKPFTLAMVLYVLGRLEFEFLDPATPEDRRRCVLMTASYICVVFGYALRGHEGLWVDADRLRKHIDVGKHDYKAGHVTVALVGRFKGEEGDRMHVLPIANKSRSGIPFRLWLERLAYQLDKEDRKNCPAFCDLDGYQLSQSDMERVFHPILEQMQNDGTFSRDLPVGMEVKEWFRCDRSFRRGAEMESLNEDGDDTAIKFVLRWGRTEKARGSVPGFNMMEHYASGIGNRYLQIKFSAGL